MTKTPFEQLQEQLSTTPDEAHIRRMQQHIPQLLEELLREIPDDSDRLIAAISFAKSIFYSVLCNLDAPLTPPQVRGIAKSASDEFFSGYVAATHILSQGTSK